MAMLSLLCALIGTPLLPAQTDPSPGEADGGKPVVALIPFKVWGGADNTVKELAARFDAIMSQTITSKDVYEPKLVDMDNLPEDVPKGGFPPFLCPSPSETGDAPYAMTGELSEGDDGIHSRFYLWDMGSNRLVFSDEMVANDEEGFEISIPMMLDWLFSWLKGPETAAAPPPAPVETPPPAPPPMEAASPPVPPPPPEPENWLYLGLRGGLTFDFFTQASKMPFEDDINYYLNMNAAFQASVQILSFFAVQAEMVFITGEVPFKFFRENLLPQDADNPPDTSMIKSYLAQFPLLLKFTYRQPRYFAAILAGAYYAMPIGEMASEYYSGRYNINLPLGYAAGISTGMKAGPGFLFLDLRWSSDLGDLTADKDALYRRSMVNLAIGYEIGIIRKKPKSPPPPKTPAPEEPAPQPEQAEPEPAVPEPVSEPAEKSEAPGQA